jgi:hypothetical protein
MSHDTINQSKVNSAENPEESIKDRILILWTLMILSFVLCFGMAYLVYKEILNNNFVLFCIALGLFGFACWGAISPAESELAELQSHRCPKCESWNSYHFKNSEVVNSWGKWEMRDFVDRTENAKGELIATTTREQQVWIDYVTSRHTHECNKCGHSHSWEDVDSI